MLPQIEIPSTVGQAASSNDALLGLSVFGWDDLQVYCRRRGYSARVSAFRLGSLRVQIWIGQRGPEVYNQAVDWLPGWASAVIDSVESKTA